MALSTKQIADLNALNKRIATGYTPNAIDTENLNFAKKQGYTYNPLPAGATKIANPNELKGLNESQLYREGASIYKLPTTIPTSELGGNLTVPPAPTPDNLDVSSMMAGLDTTNKGIQANLENYNKALASQPVKTALDQRIETEAESMYKGRTEAVKQAQTDYALPENIKNLQNLNVQIAQKTAEYNNLANQVSNLPIQSRIIGGTQDKLARQSAVELAGLSAVAQAYQGNIELANNTAKNGIDALYKPQEDYIANLKDQLASIESDLTREEKTRANSLQMVLDERARLLEEEKEEKKNISNLALSVAEKGVDSSIITSIMNAKNYADAIKIGGEYLGIDTESSIPQRIGTDAEGNDLYYDPISKSAKTALQLTTSQLGVQVGTIKGLPAYDTRSANPGVNRSDRNNNPGNIKVSDYTKTFDGVIGVESSPAEDGGNFLIFESPEDGINAIGRLLLEGNSYQGVNAETAIKKYNGGGAYGAKDVGLDPNKDFQSQIQDKTKRFNVAMAIAKAEGYTLNPVTKSLSEEAKAYARDLFDGKITPANVPQNIRGEVMLAKDELMKTEKPLKDQLQIDELNKKITSLENLSSRVSSDGRGAVGPSWLARLGLFSFNKLSGRQQDFIAGVEQLIQQETIDKLVQSKAAGATYGALSDGEREMLANSASKVGTWRILDKKGKVVGYNISEASLKKELDNIKRLAELARDRIQGDSVIEDGISEDDAYNLYLETKNK